MSAYVKGKSISHFKTNKKYWKFYKSVIKTRRTGSNQIIGEIFDSNTNQYVSSPTDLAQTFNNYFTSLKCDSSFSN